MATTGTARLLPLEGGCNLRDMGGYATADGRRVRFRTLYRSGMMSMLTEADERHLAGLGILTVCDLRSPGERRHSPNRWCEPAGVHYWSRDYGEKSGVLSEMLQGGAATEQLMREGMIALYPELLVDHAPSYRFLFERLLEGHVPALFNCSAGKDRTGVGAALILAALGVHRDEIFEDYLLTNLYLDPEKLMSRFGEHGERFRRIPPEVARPLFVAEADYLLAMFDSLDRDHGGLDAYLAGMGVDAAARARLGDMLLD